MAEEKNEKALESNPPSQSEGFGPPITGQKAGEVKRDEAYEKEKARLDRMGVVQPIGDGTRGVNVKPEAHHAPEPRLAPTEPEEDGGAYGDGEYQFQNGETMPGRGIHTPFVPTDDSAPAKAQGKGKTK